MKITNIKINKNKVIIYFDDEQLIINPNTYTEFNLFVKKNLNNDDIKKIKEYDAYSSSLAYSINLVTKYAYTTLKLRNKLSSKKISKENQNKIIDYLNKHNLLNDREFAINYAESLNRHHKGEKYIKDKLLSLGIKPEDIKVAISRLDKEESLNVLKQYIISLDKKYTRSLKVDKLDKIKEACLKSGFDLDLINKALSEVKLEKVNYLDALKKDYERAKRQYDSKDKIINVLKKKGYSYSKIKYIMEDNYDFY